ncbi:MAG TPA: hypothetical protein VKW06_00330 [Candidatus Angelobacter sp.]|nr:hypothetical protein [Candidatus Angelobacter sp.]
MTGLLIKKGFFTAEEFTAQVGLEAQHLDKTFERRFPGFSTTEDGVTMKMPESGRDHEELEAIAGETNSYSCHAARVREMVGAAPEKPESANTPARRYDDQEQGVYGSRMFESGLAAGRKEASAEVDRLNAVINTPELIDFSKACHVEAVHQRERWGLEHDSGKGPEDWFWLIGYLAGKALCAAKAGDRDKLLHHIVTTAAALNNWHAQVLGASDMRPGISAEKQSSIDGGISA